MPRRVRSVFAMLSALFRREALEDRLREEHRLHIELLAEKYMREGMPADEAQRQARIAVGGFDQTREEVRDARGFGPLEDLGRDVRYALRQLRRSPSFTAVAIVTLALGIGANTAVFTLFDAIAFRPLPVSDPAGLYRVGDGDNCCLLGNDSQESWGVYSYALYKEIRAHTREFSEMSACQAGLMNLSVRRNAPGALAAPYVAQFVAGNYFAVLGVGAVAGRAMIPSDEEPAAVPVAVMSYRAWERFGRDTGVIGASFTINTAPFTVIGIAPPGFFGETLRPDPPDLWLPLSTEPLLAGQNSLLARQNLHWLYVLGRLRPGVQPGGVQSKLTAELQQWLRAQPGLTATDRADLPKQRIDVVSAATGVASLQAYAQPVLRLLIAITGLVLLIACANLANLLLARGIAARSETAVRVALGARRLRLIRQMLTESLLLSVLGGAAALGVAFLGTRSILLIAFRGAHYVPIDPAPSLPVLALAFLLSLLTALAFGVVPAWIVSRSDPADALRLVGRSTVSSSALVRRSLVVVQIALSVVLLFGAGLLARTLRNLENQPLGFETRNRVIIRVDPASAGYKLEGLPALYQELDRRLPQIPGVMSASYSLYSPMGGNNWADNVSIEGRTGEKNNASFDRVGPRYFETIGTRLVRGRLISEQDSPTSRPVAVVNQTFARKFFPNDNPIGKHFGMGGAAHSGDFEIIGVVEDAKYQDARRPAYPTFFVPFLQLAEGSNDSFMNESHYIRDIELLVAGKAEGLQEAVRRVLADINPNLTILDSMTLTEQVSRNFNLERLFARLTMLFGLLALVLACVGLYGVTAYSVSRRTREIGLRVALGATRARVTYLVLGGALGQLLVGLVLGIPVALAGGRLLGSQLYGVGRYDAVVLGLTAGALAVCAVVAAFLPARRATAIDPMQALRME